MKNLELINVIKENISKVKESDLYDIAISGRNVMHLLSSRGEFNLIKKVLKKFPNFNMYKADADGNTLFHLMVLNGFLDKELIDMYPGSLIKVNKKGTALLKLLIHYPKLIGKYVKIALQYDSFVLLRKTKSSKSSVMTKLISKYDKKDIRKVVNYLLKDVVDINDPNSLHIIFFIIRANQYDLLKFIVDNKLIKNINLIAVDKEPILSYMVGEGRYDMIKLIVEDEYLQTDINIYGNDGRYIPMNMALYRLFNGRENGEKIVRYFLSKNVDINIRDRFGNTVAHNVLYYYDKNKKNIFNDILMSIVKKANPFIKSHDDTTILEIATKKGLSKLIPIIIKIIRSELQKNKKNDKKENNKKIVIKELIDEKIQDSNVGLLTPNTFFSVVYLSFIIEKYDDLLIPIQFTTPETKTFDIWKLNMYYNEMTHNQDKFYYSLFSEYQMFHPISPSTISWGGKDNYIIHKNLHLCLRQFLACNKRFIALNLNISFNTHTSGHAGIVIYDKKLNKLVRFEPYGIDYVGNEDDKLDDVIKDVFEKATESKVKYVRPSDYLTDFKWQTISHDRSMENKFMGDPGGYCVMWCLWFLELKLKNPDMDEKVLMKQKYDNINDYSEEIGNKYHITIRSYTNRMNTIKDKFFKKLGIPKIIHNKSYHSEKHKSIIVDAINKNMYSNLLKKLQDR